MADTTATVEDLRHSPLEHLSARFAETAHTDASVHLRERPYLTMVGLRAAPKSEALRRYEEHLGVDLPRRCGEVSRSGPSIVLWLGPDEWLVVSTADAARVAEGLGEALGEEHGSVVDLSANRTTLELSGPAARSVLEKGCSLDLHPREFGVDSAVPTLLGPVPVILWRYDEDTYRILPRSSFADYLARWLLDAMTEYNDPEAAAWH
jgi:sarcosine oxidase subunit gamma